MHALTQSTAHAHALKCLFVNTTLISKFDILKTHVFEMGVDIIGVAETFLCDDVIQAEISIEGYTCNFKDGKAGGVLLYIGMTLFLMISMILIKVSPNQSGVELR